MRSPNLPRVARSCAPLDRRRPGGGGRGLGARSHQRPSVGDRAAPRPGRPRPHRAEGAQDVGGEVRPTPGERDAGRAPGVRRGVLVRRPRPGALGVRVAEADHRGGRRQGDDHLVPRSRPRRGRQGRPLLQPGLQIPGRQRLAGQPARLFSGDGALPGQGRRPLRPEPGAAVRADRQAPEVDDPGARPRALSAGAPPVRHRRRRRHRLHLPRPQGERRPSRQPLRAGPPGHGAGEAHRSRPRRRGSDDASSSTSSPPPAAPGGAG